MPEIWSVARFCQQLITCVNLKMTSPKFPPPFPESHFAPCSVHIQRELSQCLPPFSGVLLTAFLSNTNRQTWQVARIENIKCNSGSKSRDPVSTVLLWHLIFTFHWWKTYFFPPSLPPLLPSCCFTNFSFHLRSYGTFPKFPPWFDLETSPSLPGFQASFSISAMWGMILSSCCARGRKVSSRGTCGSCKSKNGPKLSLTTKPLGHKYAWMEWTMNEPIHFWVIEISWSMLAVPHSTKLPMILHWRHNSEVTNFEIWKSGKDQVLKSWDISLFQIHPNSDSVHPILRNNKLPSCQVPNYQRVGPQFQQNNVRNLHCCDAPHLSSGPKAEELRPCSSEIPNWHPRYARSKLANLPHNCDIALISVFSFCFKALRYGEIHGDQKMAPLLSRKSKVMAPSTKGNTVSTPWTKKSASFKKANPTDQSSWLVFDRAIWQYHSSALSVELLTF